MSDDEPYWYDVNEWLKEKGIGFEDPFGMPSVRGGPGWPDLPDSPNYNVHGWIHDKILLPIWDSAYNQEALTSGVGFESPDNFLRGYWDYRPIPGFPTLGQLVYGDLPDDPTNWFNREVFMTIAGLAFGVSPGAKLVARRVAGFIYDNYDTLTFGYGPHIDYDKVPNPANFRDIPGNIWGTGKDFFVGSRGDDSGIEKMIKFGLKITRRGERHRLPNVRDIEKMRDDLQPKSYSDKQIQQMKRERKTRKVTTYHYNPNMSNAQRQRWWDRYKEDYYNP